MVAGEAAVAPLMQAAPAIQGGGEVCVSCTVRSGDVIT